MRRFNFPVGYVVFAGLIVAAVFLAFVGLGNNPGLGYAESFEDEMIVVVSADEALDRVAASPIVEQAFEVRYGNLVLPGPQRDAARGKALKAFRRLCRNCAELQFRDQIRDGCPESEVEHMARYAARVMGSGAADSEFMAIVFPD